MLVHKPNPNITEPQPTQFDLLHHAVNKTANTTEFRQRRLNCGPPGSADALKCHIYYMQQGGWLQTMTINKPRHFDIIATDGHSYLIASMCYDYGVMHDQELLVLAREKQPSKFIRAKILKTLKDRLNMSNDGIKQLAKGQSHECWGDDMYL